MTDDDFLDDGQAALEWARAIWTASAICRCSRRSSRATSARACRRAAGGGRAVLRRPARPRRGPAAGHHPLAAPALLRLLRGHRVAPGDPRRDARRRAQPGRVPVAHSPASTELEGLVCDWVAQLLGLPAGWHGHIEDTASTSTLAALIAARHTTGRASPSAPSTRTPRSRRARACSAWSCARCPPTTSSACASTLSTSATPRVVATVGTTSTTSVDPVRGGRRPLRADRHWLHVDAAYAGSAMVCPEHRWAFAGVERADSLVVNAHKWMLTPMDCSLLWTSRPEDFRAAFSLVPEFLRTPDAEDALSLTSTARRSAGASARSSCGRCCAATAASGLQAMIREHVRLAELFEGRVREEPGWELVRAAALLARLLPQARAPTRRTRRSSSASTRAASCSSRTPGSTAAMCCGSRSAPSARPKRTCAGPGTCSARLSYADGTTQVASAAAQL